MRSLTILALAFVLSIATAQIEEEDYVQLSFRTFGWGMEADLVSPLVNEVIQVPWSSFSEQIRYSGPPLMTLYQDTTALLDSEGLMLTRERREQVVSQQQTGDKPVDIIPVAQVPLPKAGGKLLLVFVPNPQSNKPLYRVIVMDDSLAEFDEPNVHFYNMTDTELVVRVGSEAKTIASRQQAVWPTEIGGTQASIAIAVRNPETRVIYSSRFRLREGRRAVFFARRVGEMEIDGVNVPKINVLPRFEDIGEKQEQLLILEAPDEMADGVD
ncbi:hypothetical protein QEH59_06990 [Coraliomargarita sp. SDUM461004]|uniref:Uncharacterized protein n=2 Tax=Thalassobacterium sedimentorum TaxID=3041258 RepID=A0ABU1AJ31_9BACT|nr:hypothetical protein [Coraliomargarita sp. SDUM461004]